MFAVIKTGGKQYRVAANDEFEIERLPGVAGDSVSFAEVLMVGTTIGAPFVAGATVTGEIVEQKRAKKVISFKKRRRQNSKRTRGHRQELTLIRIGEILTDGQAPSAKTAKAAKTEDASTGEDVAPKAEKPKKAAKAKNDAPETADAGEAKAETAAKKPRATKKKADGESA